MPEGRTWGSTSAVDIDKDGQSIWVGERCGKTAEGRAANRCVSAAGEVSPLDPILKFDPSGKLVRSFGAGMFVFPHGIHVENDGLREFFEMVRGGAENWDGSEPLRPGECRKRARAAPAS